MGDRTRQNLIDAGCSHEFIEQFGRAQSKGEQLRQLQTRRKELLGGIHSEQRKLDCLDYLIYEIQSSDGR